jgi:tetratricopeptide (TPR) repeat protein
VHQTNNGLKWSPLFIVIASVVIYAGSLSGAFVFDDLPHIVDNPRIRQLSPVSDIVLKTSRPMVHLSLAINYAMGGLNPAGYRVVNIIIHTATALLLWGLIRRTLRGRCERADLVAFGAALLWVAHPLNTQAVTYIIQRGESLMSLFYVGVMYCVARGWNTGAIVCCALGMATKPIMATAPLMALLYDRAFMAGSLAGALKSRWKLYAGLAATWLLLPWFLYNAPGEWRGSAGFAFQKISVSEYALTQPGVILHYLRLAFWPDELCLDYGWKAAQVVGDILPGLVIVGGMLGLTVWGAYRNRPWAFAGIWTFLILAPTSSVIPIADVAFEHRMYLPLAAVLTVALCALRKVKATSVLAIVLAAMVGLGWRTVERNKVYRTQVTIWTDTVAKRPENPRARVNLGNALCDEGRFAESVPHFEEALRLDAGYAQAHNNLGRALAMLDRTSEAAPRFRQALVLQPGYAEAHYNLGTALHRLGQRDEAVRQLREAVKLKPDYVDAWSNLGLVLTELGRLPEAMECFEKATALRPDFAEAYYNWGNALFAAGKFEEAAGRFEQTIRIRPAYAPALFNLGATLARLGRSADARRSFSEASRLDPRFKAPETGN